MNVEDIKSLVVETLQRPELTLQVNQTGQNLSIVINRPQSLEVDYEGLTRQILEAFLDKLSPEDLTSIEAIKFFGRIKGQPKQEWQKLQKLSALPQKKVEPEPFDVKPQTSPTAPITNYSETSQTDINPSPSPSYSESVRSRPSNSYQSRPSTPSSNQPDVWRLINDFKFGQLLITFKDIISTGALVGIFLILLLNFFAGQKPRSVEWEYKIEAVPDLIFTQSMDMYGKEGWELVTARRAVDDGTASYECIFKRVRR